MFRIRETGQIITESEFRSLHSTTSFPFILTLEILDAFGVDPILEGAFPAVTEDQYVAQDGVEQDAKGNWVKKYVAVDYTPEEISARLQAKRASMVVSPFQAKAALHKAGLLSQVQTLIDDSNTDPIVVLAWNNAQEFRRNSEMIESLASKLNLTDKQIDNLFVDAAKIIA